MKDTQQIENFMIVFRTFGHDIPDIVEEYNAFIDDKHPYFAFRENFSSSLTSTSISSATTAATKIRKTIDLSRDVCKLSRKCRDEALKKKNEHEEKDGDLFLKATFGMDSQNHK